MSKRVKQMSEDVKVRQLSKVAVCVASMFYGSVALANPSGAEVVNGSASFDQQGSQLNITNSHGTIINWNEFSIAENEAVKFLQDNANSAVLNRVVGQLPSDILGELSSNGKVFLINPNGLLIGNGARIDTSGFVGSTLDISNEDFIAGNMTFKGNRGRIQNQGYITAGKNGEVVLIAPQVENNGIIEAEDGNILLAAGREVTLHSLDNPGIAFRVSAAGDEVLNLGQLLAENGSVKVFADRIMQQGTISANRMTQRADGTIVLEADAFSEISGTVSAKGTDTSGGEIHILADNEVNVKAANIDASGESGGEVLVGGDYQGNGTVKNAQNTNIDASTVINADAGRNGDGGRVIVWSDDTTNTYARITARGGSQSGDGGFVETSGKKTLDFGQPADVSASNGAAGTWLLDPEDIVIDEGKAASISTSLNGGSNVEVKTSDEGDGEGNITVEAAITKTEGDSAVTLTLDAHNRVDVNAPISSTAGPLNVNIKTGRAVANASSSVEAPRDEPRDEPTDSSPDELVSTDEDQQIVEADNAESPEQVAGVSGEESVDEVVESGEQTTNDLITVQDETEIDTPLDLNADNINDGIDNQAVIVVESSDIQFDPEDGLTIPEEEVQTGVLVIEESSEPASLDTEVQTFIDEDVQQVVITEDIDTAGGSFSIQAGEEGDAIISSEITTSRHAESEGQGAGDITIEADRIALTDDAVVDASGEDAGDILIGGDRQGRNDEVQNADFVYVSEDAQIKSDGGENGDGGKVIVFAKDTAIVQGSITAKGGTESGDGGFIETSGLRGLRVTKAPDASASNGKAGEWLIDPFDIIVGDNAGSNTSADTSGDPWVGTAIGAIIDQAILKTGLLAGDVTITTTGAGPDVGNITFNANIDFDAADADGTGSLTLSAHNNIYFAGNLIDSDMTHAGNNNHLTDLVLIANSDNTGGGSVIFDGPNLVASAGGNMNVEVNNDINVSGDSVEIIGSDTSGYGGMATDSINLVANADNDMINGGDINFGTMATPIGNGGLDKISINADQGAINLNGQNINFYSAGIIDIDAGTVENASVTIDANESITMDAGVASDITIDGGTDNNASVDITSNGNQVYDANNIIVKGGTALNTHAELKTEFANQTFTATNNIEFLGGDGSGASAGAFGRGDQNFTSAILKLVGGNGSMAHAFIEIEDGGGTQTINTSGLLKVEAGMGTNADAFIADNGSGGMSQIINAQGGLDIISTSSALAELYSDLNQIITVGTASMDANLNMTGTMINSAQINSDEAQMITVYGDLVMDNASIASMGYMGSYNTVDVKNLKVNDNASISNDDYAGMTTLTTTGAGSVINAGASGTLNLSNVVWEQEGTVDWQSGDIDVNTGSGFTAQVNNSGTFYVNSETGPANSGMGTLTVDTYFGSFANTGTVKKDSGTGVTILNAIFNNDGDLISAAGTIDFGGSGSLDQSSGETLLEGGSFSSINGFNFTGGELNGGTSSSILTGGQLTGNVFLQDTTVNPGHSPGTLTIDGDLDAGPGGNVFNMEIGGTATGEYDKIDVTGIVNIPASNSMNVTFVNGYTGPEVIDDTDTIPDVIAGGATSSIIPAVSHGSDAGITPTDMQVGDNLELTYTRDFFPEEPPVETPEEPTDGGMTEEGMMTETPPAIMTEEDAPDVINLIVTITDDQKQALVDAGLLEPDEEDDDEDGDKKDKPKGMCIGA